MGTDNQLVAELPKRNIFNRFFVKCFKYFPRRIFSFLSSEEFKIYQQTLLLRKHLVSQKRLKDVKSQLPDNITIGLLGENVLTQMLAHKEALPEYVYHQRLKNGDVCYYQLDNGVLVNYNWISFTKCSTYRGFDKEIYYLELTRSQAFTYDFYTYKCARRQGYGSSLKEYLIADLAESGIKEIYSSVEPENRKSLNIHLRFGYQLVNVVQNFRLMHWSFSIWAGKSYCNKIILWLNTYREQLNEKDINEKN